MHMNEQGVTSFSLRTTMKENVSVAEIVNFITNWATVHGFLQEFCQKHLLVTIFWCVLECSI